ncbi:MAG TPA: N-acetyltransferase [Nocardioides bacterium]|uniref:GNAT family N-acetyltransferase n=1 Tax=uncultured Nocardioides sp. TaxID=198441 RepID=UPI000EC3AB7C|nr:GNAT family protein [uncultured Nocardioides sp.]HCB05808.1 N-acetyltransferase [Nocardioides sp.]HRD60541.1 GNAT family protein [Nocardioides sp.]
MSLPQVVDTGRLRLPLWTADDVARVRDGERASGWHPDFPREDDRDAASIWRDGDPWGPRSIELDHVVVGSIGFFGPPEPANDGVPETEVGYGLVEDARGAGVATEALTALLAGADRAGVRIRASVLPDNTPSIRVLAKCGFTELRGSNGDGELVMARPLR